MEYLNAIELWNMGMSFLLEGKTSEAMACFDRALEKEPGLAVAWDSKGVVLNRFARHHEAIECFDRAIEIDPTLASSWLGKGRALVKLGRKEEAINCFRRAVDIEPRMRELLERYGFQ